MAINAAAAYQNNKIKTASRGELTLMLYEGAIKFCNIAIDGISERNYSKVNENIKKAEKIIVELRSTLNMKYPIASEFDRIYDYIYRRLLEANIKKDSNILEEVREHLRELRDTWKEVMKKANM